MNRRPSDAIPRSHSLLVSVVCFVLALLCFALILSGCASSNTGRILNVGVVAAGALDLHSTRAAMAKGAHEANPLVGDSATGQALLKAAGIGTVIGLSQLIENKGHTTLAQVMRSLAIVVWSAAAVYNYQIVR